jgi:predicted GIY-YIG superfamily endonuclease
MKYLVYEIVSPETNLPVYVGSTCDLKARIAVHRSGGNPSTREFFKKHPNPFVRVLDEFDNKEEAVQFETDVTIGLKYAGFEILNRDFGNTKSPETRKKIGEAHRGKIISEETRKKLSEAKRDRTIYHFRNKRTGEERISSKYELKKEFDLHSGHLS